MNQSLLPRDRGNRNADPSWASGHRRAVSRATGLVRGVAAAAAPLTVGPCCATFARRSFLRRRVGVWANAAEASPAGHNSGDKQESPPRPKPGGPGEEEPML